MPVIAVYARLVVWPLLLIHTLPAVKAGVIVGNGFTVKVKVVPVLVHPFALVTTIVPVYVAAARFAGTFSVIGLNGKVVLATFTKPAVAAAASHVIV